MHGSRPLVRVFRLFHKASEMPEAQPVSTETDETSLVSDGEGNFIDPDTGEIEFHVEEIKGKIFF